jgi:hypothetical protein
MGYGMTTENWYENEFFSKMKRFPSSSFQWLKRRLILRLAGHPYEIETYSSISTENLM